MSKRPVTFDARIREGYAVNEPVRSIADALGVNKNVIIGRAFRLGLSRPERLKAALQRGEGGKANHSDPIRSARVVAALHAGRDRHFAARKARAA